MYEQAQPIDHRELLASAEAMEPVSATVARLAALIAQPDHDVRDVIEALSLDQALTVTVLRRANSATTGPYQPVKTVRDATLRLGTSSLMSLVLSSAVSGRMEQALPAYGLSDGELWRQSVAASVAAEVIRPAAKVPVPFETSTAALLHDIGKVVIAKHFGADLVSMIGHAAAAENGDLCEAERAAFGVSHADVGGVVAQQWRLPYSIVEGIIHHHRTDPDQSPISAAVSLACAMVPEILADADISPRAIGSGREQETGAQPLRVPATVSHSAVMARLAISPAKYPELLHTARTRFSLLAERYEVA